MASRRGRGRGQQGVSEGNAKACHALDLWCVKAVFIASEMWVSCSVCFPFEASKLHLELPHLPIERGKRLTPQLCILRPPAYNLDQPAIPPLQPLPLRPFPLLNFLQPPPVLL